jgi:hypothetical protein
MITIAIKSTSGPWARWVVNLVASSKNPETRNLRDNDHHAQQKRDGVEIDGFEGFLEAQSPERDHQACADKRDAGTVDPSSARGAKSE